MNRTNQMNAIHRSIYGFGNGIVTVNCDANFQCDIGASSTQLSYDNGNSYFKCDTYSCLSGVPCHV